MTATENAPGEITLGPRRTRYLLDRERVLGPALMTPAVVYLLLVVAYPLMLAFVYAFSDVTTGSQSLHLVGFRTFIAAVDDPVFLTTLRNTFFITAVSQALVVVLSVVLAFLLALVFAVFCGFPFLWAALTMFRQDSDLYVTTHSPFVFAKPATLGHITDLLRNTPTSNSSPTTS